MFANSYHIGFNCNNVQFLDRLELELFGVEDGLMVVAVSSRNLNCFQDILMKCAVSVSEAAEEVRQRPTAGGRAQLGPPCDWTDWPNRPGRS